MSRGGKNTKIHVVCDALGNPLHVHLSSGNVHDSKEAVKALATVPLEGSVVLGDKAYGSAEIRSFIQQNNAQYCIPPKTNDKDPWPCDWWQYKERHVIECLFQKLKQFRRIATRYEKLAARFLAVVQLGCIFVWLK